MVLTKTHLDGNILDFKILPTNLTVFRNYRQQLGRYSGGVLIAARSTLKIIQRDDIICQSELLFVDIFLKRDKLTIGIFYRPPNGNIEHLEDLQNVLSEISPQIS